MMNEPRSSDLAKVAGKPTNKAGVERRRSRWSQGRGPRGTRTSKARTGRSAGPACHRRGARAPSSKVRSKNGSLRCSTISTLICCGCRSMH